MWISFAKNCPINTASLHCDSRRSLWRTYITCRCINSSLKQNTVHYTGRWPSPDPPLTVEQWIVFTLPIPNPDSSFIGLYLLEGWEKGHLWKFMENLYSVLSWERGANPESLIVCYSLTQVDFANAKYFDLNIIYDYLKSSSYLI